MRYIIRYITHSKYFGYKRINYKEFDNYEEMIGFIRKNKLKHSDYTIYSLIIL